MKCFGPDLYRLKPSICGKKCKIRDLKKSQGQVLANEVFFPVYISLRLSFLRTYIAYVHALDFAQLSPTFLPQPAQSYFAR